MPVFHTKTIESILEPVAQQVRIKTLCPKKKSQRKKFFSPNYCHFSLFIICQIIISTISDSLFVSINNTFLKCWEITTEMKQNIIKTDAQAVCQDLFQ